MIIKLRSARTGGDQVREQIFAGPDVDHLQLAGEIVLTLGEWQAFGAALILGAGQMSGKLAIITDGHEQVVAVKEEDVLS